MTAVMAIINLGFVFNDSFACPNIALASCGLDDRKPPIPAKKNGEGYAKLKTPPTNIPYSKKYYPQNTVLAAFV